MLQSLLTFKKYHTVVLVTGNSIVDFCPNSFNLCMKGDGNRNALAKGYTDTTGSTVAVKDTSFIGCAKISAQHGRSDVEV